MKMKTLFSAAILHTAFLFPQESWMNTMGSNWNNAANWAPPVVPNGMAVTVTFGSVILAPSTVTLDIPVTFGGMTFNSAQSYTIAPGGSNSFTLQGAPTNITDTTGAHTISVPILLNNNLSVTQNSTGNLTLSGVISGTNSLTIQGAGTGHVVLSAANLYTGGTTVSAAVLDCNATAALPAAGALTISGGTVNCNIANTLPSTGLITLSGGTLQLNDNSQSAGPITGTSNIVLGVLPQTILTSTTSATTAYSGVIGGAGGFTLAGSSGVLTFSVAQIYAGGTTVNGSTLTSGINNALATTGNLTVNSPGIFNLNNFNQTVAVFAGSGSMTLGSGNLTTNTATNSTFSGGISGTGTFTQAGTSTLAFTGINTYTGGTTVSNGTLQLGVNNALASMGPVTLSGGILDISPSTLQSMGPLSGTSNVTMGAAQLTINSTASSSYGGVLSGTGSLVVVGPQTLTLTNNNTFNGGTTINGGTLALGINNALLPTGNLTVNSPGMFDLAGFNQAIGVLLGNGSITLGAGTLTVNTPAMTTSNFSGVISQAGALDVGGTGILILTGPNTYTGGTVVAAGATLQGTTTTLQGTINNSGSLIFNQPFNRTFSGSLLGAGALFLNGTGSVILQGTQTQGSTTVNAGQLILGTAANLISSPVTIEFGAALGTTGNGTITGNVTVNGTTQVGLGTMHVVGNYTQQTAGSIFGVEVTPTTSGLLAVTGTVTLLDEPSMDVSFQPGPFAPSTLYTLMTAGAPVAGIFAAPTFENPFFEGSLIYNGVGLGSVQLLLNIAPFGNVIKGGNAGAIAKCIDIQAFPSESDLLPIIQTLIFLPVDTVRDALEEMQPSQMKALTLTEENNLVLIRTAVSQHIDDLNKTTCNQCMSEMYKWNVWSNFSGDFLRQKNQSENIGYDANTAAATIGMDIAVTKNLFLGLAGAYDYSWLTWNHSRGHGRISSYYAGPYFSWFNRRVFMSLSVLGTWNNYQASRHISFPFVDRHAKSHHHGHGLIAHYDIGVMMYPAEEMSFSPIAGIDYIHLHESGFTEHDAGSLNLTVKPSHADLLRSELGLKVAKCAVFTHHKWTHDLKLSWIHEHLFSGKHLHAKFTEVDCLFTVNGLEPNEDYFDVATGLTGIFMEDKLSASVRYEGKFGDGIRDNTAYIQLTYRF